jgi:hypothetical protein
MTSTYTLLNADGAVIERGLTAAEAADAILSHDGGRHARREIDGITYLFVYDRARRDFVHAHLPRGFGGRSDLIGSYAADKAARAAEIDALVIRASSNPDWSRVQAMTDAEYDAMAAA